MSPGRLTMKVMGWGVSPKIVLELLTRDDRSRCYVISSASMIYSQSLIDITKSNTIS